MWEPLAFILISSSFFLVAYAIAYRPQWHLHLGDEDFKSTKKKKSLFAPEQLHNMVKPLRFITIPLSRRLNYLKGLRENTDILRIGLDLELLIALKILLSLLLGVLVFYILPNDQPRVGYGLLALLVAFFLPDFFIVRKIRQKKEEIVRCFPETVDLLDMCISAGADLVSAIRWVINKSHPNAFIEQLGIAIGEIQVGKPRAEALRAMSRRLKIPDVASFSRAIVQAERMGTSVEEAFRNLSDDTRDRRYQNGERYAIKASLKILFPLIFCILPAIMIIVAGPILIKFTQGELIPTSF
jgi:pilus assembly protein TadC